MLPLLGSLIQTINNNKLIVNRLRKYIIRESDFVNVHSEFQI